MKQAAPAVVAAAGGGRQPQQQRIGKSIQGTIRTHLQISNRYKETMKKLLQKIFIIRLSRIQGIILAISCCIAVRKLGSGRLRKLGSGRLSCPLLSVSIENILVQLMNSSYTLVSVGKLHHLASEAGFEEEFLLHFGTKIMPTKSIEDIKFWIGLVQKKLSVAFHRESVISGKQVFCDKETRLFLSRMKIKDLDEQVEDFLGYVECGSLFTYPRLISSLPEYQLFMEVSQNIASETVFGLIKE